jgi:hypothetical protein
MRFRLCSRSLLFPLFMLTMSVASFAQIGVTISFAPPALPVYEQPLCPGEGYIWTPGYWAYDNDYGDYYWVPGTWVLAPQVGYLWTPPYWGWDVNGFIFHEGYWGPQVGFYGGIAYGYGYYGRGYEGGRWNNGQFYYNRSVNNINVTNIHNVYNTTVINNTTVNHVSYNGGNGGVTAAPTAAEEAAARSRHIPPVPTQNQQVQAAQSNPQLRASANQGRPPIAATDKPGAFSGSGAVPAKAAGAPYHPPTNRAAVQPAQAPHAAAQPGARPPAAQTENNAPHAEPAVHAKDLSGHPQPAPRYTGDTKADQNYQQQQQKLNAQQQQEHQKLAQQQEQDHKQLTQQQASAARTQQLEQQHQQQTQQMEQRHTQQQQQLSSRQTPPPSHNEARPPAEKH